MTYKIGASMLLLLVAGLSVAYAQSSACTTFDGRQGNCRSMSQCPQIISSLNAANLTDGKTRSVQKYQCGFNNGIPLVCCASTGNGNPNVQTQRPIVTNTTTQRKPTCRSNNNNKQRHHINNELLPADCGRQATNRTVGGSATDLWHYPWLALLEYDTPTGIQLGCGGALISSRYVLTAAHCLKSRLLSATWLLNRVRLGEYNIQTERDCVPDGLNHSVCVIPSINISIEERIVHEDYDPQIAVGRYDIALLRLASAVSFTSYVRPICLPRKSHPGKFFKVAGWGRTESRGRSDVKLQVTVPFVDRQNCSEVYRGFGAIIGEGQMCAGGKRVNDSCISDSGGPLMLKRCNRWYAVGLVSYGPRMCGIVGVPGIYTKVLDFVSWVTSKLRR